MRYESSCPTLYEDDSWSICRVQSITAAAELADETCIHLSQRCINIWWTQTLDAHDQVCNVGDKDSVP